MSEFGFESTADEVLAGHDLNGRTALVTGGYSGLGKETARAMAAKGAHVILAGRDATKLSAAADEIAEGTGARVDTLVCDLASLDSVRAAAKDAANRFDKIDLLINNVGNYNPQHVTKLDPAVWDATLAANLSGAYYCCYHALDLMQSGGHIINIGMAGLEGIRANVHGTDYYVSKTGLLVLTRALAAAHAKRQIRVPFCI